MVESTNIYAMDRLQANLAAHGMAFFTDNQTAGKGQHGKTWFAEPGSNMALSVVLDTASLSLAKQFPLSVMVALACYDLYSKYASDETRIKWPNDIYWRDRKAGGILIENLVRGNKWQGAVAGIGINLNQVLFPEMQRKPVSLKQITGNHFDTVAFAKELCECMELRYQQLMQGEFAVMLLQYNERLFKKGERVKLKSGPAAFYCTVTGVSADGELEVSGGPKESFRFGEVEWVIE